MYDDDSQTGDLITNKDVFLMNCEENYEEGIGADAVPLEEECQELGEPATDEPVLYENDSQTEDLITNKDVFLMNWEENYEEGIEAVTATLEECQEHSSKSPIEEDFYSQTLFFGAFPLGDNFEENSQVKTDSRPGQKGHLPDDINLQIEDDSYDAIDEKVLDKCLELVKNHDEMNRILQEALGGQWPNEGNCNLLFEHSYSKLSLL